MHRKVEDASGAEAESETERCGIRGFPLQLPRQHALVSHYYTLIKLFGSPNGLCSSITESEHIKSVKEPWHCSSRFKALVQMLRSIL